MIEARETVETIDRQTGLGGSDAAAVFGLSPYKTPARLAQEKRGEIDPEDVSSKQAVKWGIRLEDAVAEAFSEESGHTLHRVNRTLRHPGHSFLFAHIDRRVVGEYAGFEAKTTGLFAADQWGESGTDEIPEPYLMQIAHYQAVTGYRRFYCAVLIGGQELRTYVIERDESLVDMVVKGEVEFWNRYVVGSEVPKPADLAEVRRRFPVAQATPIEATDEIAQAIENLAVFNEHLAATEKERDAIQLQVLDYMGDADTLTYQNGTLATWKSIREFQEAELKATDAGLYTRYCVKFDTAAFKANEGKKAYESFLAAGTKRRFLLTKEGK